MKQNFNLLLGVQVSISNGIFEGERSFKLPSTKSRLVLVRSPSFLLHHHLALATTVRAQHMRQPGFEPLPSSEGCGLNF